VTSIAVIIPAYRAERFLDQALASVAAQERPADDVVVVDDASPDGTSTVARRWESLLPLTVWRKPVNGGLGAARRDAIAKSSGELVALLDADDVWLPDHLAVLEEQHRRHGGIVLARAYRWNPGRRVAHRPVPSPRSVPSRNRQATAILDRNFAPCIALFARDSYDRAGGFRPLRLDEDWDLWMRMVRLGERFTLAPTVTALRRVHGSSLSSAEACLDYDLALLHEARQHASRREAAVIDRAIRRREARRLLLAGYAAARRNDMHAARRHWLRAAVQDRSLRAPFADGAGSVSLRAAACLLAPRRTVDLRDARATGQERPVLRLAR
jgi:glycosyltransferase involved in cell wall biosynthesis